MIAKCEWVSSDGERCWLPVGHAGQHASLSVSGFWKCPRCGISIGVSDTLDHEKRCEEQRKALYNILSGEYTSAPHDYASAPQDCPACNRGEPCVTNLHLENMKLQAKNSELLVAIEAAARSLEAISHAGHRESTLETLGDVRQYAASRAGAAREALK